MRALSLLSAIVLLASFSFARAESVSGYEKTLICKEIVRKLGKSLEGGDATEKMLSCRSNGNFTRGADEINVIVVIKTGDLLDCEATLNDSATGAHTGAVTLSSCNILAKH